MTDPVCVDHNPQQHRDGKPPWCRKCGLTAAFTVPVSRLGNHKEKNVKDTE